MQSIVYKNLYSLPVDEIDNIDNESSKSFIFQGTKNWDLYFDKTPKNSEISEFKNVLLLHFSGKNEFENYLHNNEIIDYSLEHVSELNKYFVLVTHHG